MYRYMYRYRYMCCTPAHALAACRPAYPNQSCTHGFKLQRVQTCFIDGFWPATEMPLSEEHSKLGPENSTLHNAKPLPVPLISLSLRLRLSDAQVHSFNQMLSFFRKPQSCTMHTRGHSLLPSLPTKVDVNLIDKKIVHSVCAHQM